MLDVHVRVSLPNFIRFIISFYMFFSLFATITAFELNVFRKTDFIIALEVHILQLPPGRDKIIINCTIDVLETNKIDNTKLKYKNQTTPTKVQ